MKRKILMVCEAFGGGVFAYVSQLCNDMCETYEVYLAYSLRSQTPTNFRDLLDNRVSLIEVENFNSLGNVISVVKLIRELKRIEKEINPDVIHLHSSIAGGIGRISFSGKNNRLVYTPHGYAHILMGETKSFKCLLYKSFEWLLGNKSHCITLTCCQSEDEEAKKMTKRSSYVETGINTVELSSYLKNIIPERKNKFTVYTLGRTCIQKQPQLFNDIAERVPEARFVWIGSGELDGLLKSKNIELTGWKPRNVALAMGKGADVFILCSLGEAIAMSVIENMFMGKLVLVSNKMGNKSVIKNGVNGFVCDTVDDYVTHIKDAMADFPNKLCEQARQDVYNIYNTDVMKEKYIRFYNDVISGKFD